MNKRKTRKPLTDEQRKLVEDNTGLAYEFVHRKGFTYGYEFEDAVQIALLGLIYAAMTFKESKSKFSTYAFFAMQSQFNIEYRKIKRQKESGIINVSLSEPITENEELSVEDVVVVEHQDSIENIETVIAIKDAYEKLNDKEKQVISMIFYAKEKEANQRSVAKKLGVSQSFVSRTVKKFKEYLKG